MESAGIENNMMNTKTMFRGYAVKAKLMVQPETRYVHYAVKAKLMVQPETRYVHLRSSLSSLVFASA